jgi:hypothetical protein
MPDDPILAELRSVREEMLVEFPTDEALFRAMKAHEAERVKRGEAILPLPAPPRLGGKPNAA